jgi:hypothetical protein
MIEIIDDEPVTLSVTAASHLVAGERRIRAFQSLGWSRIPARRVNLQSLIRGEHDENELGERRRNGKFFRCVSG